jgi:hypothetical protein
MYEWHQYMKSNMAEGENEWKADAITNPMHD